MIFFQSYSHFCVSVTGGLLSFAEGVLETVSLGLHACWESSYWFRNTGNGVSNRQFFSIVWAH